MPFVTSNGARIHWEAEGAGHPVLLIMGHLYSGRMWYPLLPALTRTRRAIWFDNRGAGESDTTASPSIADFAADALAVLDAAGAERAHIYGVSMGGGVAQAFAMRYPDRVASLVLGCTMMKTAPTPRGPWIRRLIYHMPAWLIRAIPPNRAAYGSAAPASAVTRDIEVQKGERINMPGARAQAAAISSYATTPEAVSRLAMPVLVLHGDEDGAVDVKHGRELAATIPGARLVEFPGAGHNYLAAAGEASTAAVLGFFDEVEAQGGVGAH